MFAFNFNNIKEKKLLLYFLFLAAIILPGFGYLYLENKDLFIQLDYVKLILLSFLYTLPIIISSFARVFLHDESKEKDGGDYIIFTASAETILWFLVFWFMHAMQDKSANALAFYGIPIIGTTLYIFYKYIKYKLPKKPAK